jgi:hypothetical protein
MPGRDSSSRDGGLDGPIHFASLQDVARLIESGELTSVELTELMLARIESIDSRLKSYATVMADHAREAARLADEEIRAGTFRGPLHGMPVAVKDLCYTKGVRTMGGSGALSDLVPEYDATVVTKLKESGAVLLGKLNLTEGAMGGYHADFELPVNPWQEELWAGASSSGSGVANWWIDSVSINGERRRWIETHLRACKPVRSAALGRVSRPCRSHGADRERHRHRITGHCRS